MRIVNLTWNDYSNFSFSNAKSLQSIGVDCKAYTITPHEFGYKEQARVVSYAEMKQLACEVDIIQLFHTQVNILELVKNLNKHVIAYHTGTGYRQSPDEMNALFNPYVDFCFTDSPEFMTLGAKGVKYIATAIDTDEIKPELANTPYLFAHFPSKATTKGTDKIWEMVCGTDNIENLLAIERNILPHAENLKRINDRAPNYIEMFNPYQGDKPYGSFGVTAFEAAALDKVVITNSMFHNIYTGTYGLDSMLIANNEGNFKYHITEIISGRFTVNNFKVSPREWIIQKHGLKPSGEYLAKCLGL